MSLESGRAVRAEWKSAWRREIVYRNGVTITNPHVQLCLSPKSLLVCWIGLFRSDLTSCYFWLAKSRLEWIWVIRRHSWSFQVNISTTHCSLFSWHLYRFFFFFFFFSRDRTVMSSNSPQSGAKAIAEPDEATVPKSTEEQPMIVLPSDATLLTRKNSLSSSSSKTSDCPDICRICHCEGTDDEPLISPCLCLGTMQYLHQSCLQRWIKSAGVKSCELCKFEFIMHSEIKPFKQVELFALDETRISNARCFQWQKLDMNIVERRKVMCSVAFNLIAVTCVLWSLYVLIEKTREEVKAGKLRKISRFL